MVLYSFGGVNDQYSATSWAVQETGMLPLLSCDSDMTAWLKIKGKQKGSGVSGEEDKRPQMTLIAIQLTVVIEERRRYIIYDIVI